MKLKLLSAALTAGLMGSAGMASAENVIPAPVAVPVAVPVAGAVAAPVLVDGFAQAMAARQVAEFARRQKDPAAMLTAARMLHEIPVSGADDGDAAFTPTALFAEARQFARGDTLLLQQILVAESDGHRGVMSSAFGKGLVRVVQPVNPLATYQFTINAKGGEPLRIGAIGDVGTSLVMRLQDDRGKVVCLDDNGDYAPICQLTPRAGGQFRVDVLNKSKQRSRAVILSN